MDRQRFSPVCMALFCAGILVPGLVLSFVPRAWAASAELTAVSAPAESERASLVVHIRDVSPAGGIMRLGVYDEAGYPNDRGPVVSADVPAHPGETVIHLTDLRPGTYAIEVYQDINSNDRMDRSWIGLPLEPYGFSRNARPVLSKPDFARVSFAVKAGRNVQTLHLQNVNTPTQ
jgi:uncharacterized protein (DUF2141 family)